MEIVILIALGFAAKAAVDHVRADYARTRDARVKAAAKAAGITSLPKAARAKAVRRHRGGYLASEVAHGFPVTRTGWHAGWLAHRSASAHHKARREEARTESLETEVAFASIVPGHRKRQADARANLAAIEDVIAAAPGPVTSRKAVQEAAEAAVLPFRRRGAASAPGVPPLPADSVARPGPAVVRQPLDLVPDDSAYLRPGETRCEGCGGTGRSASGTGACLACRGFGSAAPDPASPLAAPGAVCGACGRTGGHGDPVLADPGGNIHLSHATEQQEAYWDALNRLRAQPENEDAARPTASPQTASPSTAQPAGGTPVVQTLSVSPEDDERAHRQMTAHAYSSPTTGGTVTDHTFTSILNTASTEVGRSDRDSAAIRSRKEHAYAAADAMQAAGADPAAISAQMEHADRLATAEKALTEAGETAAAVASAVQRFHGGVQEATDNSPGKVATREFHGGA